MDERHEEDPAHLGGPSLGGTPPAENSATRSDGPRHLALCASRPEIAERIQATLQPAEVAGRLEVIRLAPGDELGGRLDEGGADLLALADDDAGRWAIGRLRGLRRAAGSIPVVVLTTGGEVRGAIAALRSGASDYISLDGLESDRMAANKIEEGVSRALREGRRHQLDTVPQEDERWYRSMFEHALTGNFVLTLDGEIRACNRAFLEVFGFPSEEAASTVSFDDFFGSPAEGEELRRQVAGDGCVENQEVELRRTDGKSVHALLCATGHHDFRGSVAEIHGSLLDITKRRRLEERLTHSRKLEALGRLAGGIAHDFNNLLTVIVGHAAAALDTEALADQARLDLEAINHAADSASSLTRQLLTFSRSQPMQPEIIDLTALVVQLELMLERVIGEHIELVTLLSDKLWAVEADPAQLEQVIMNLVLNARDAMPGGGRLTIETQNVEIEDLGPGSSSELIPGRYVLLAVTDTGCGMDQATLAQIFEPFFSTKDPSKGTGLGLATVYGTVEQAGGKIWAYSEQGLGTTFKIFLPRADSQEADHQLETAANLPAAARPATLLVAEDSDMVRRLIVTVLREHCYEVLEAAGGEEALMQAAAHPGALDLLISDLLMADMRGPELLERVKEIRPEINVLFISGYTAGGIDGRGGMSREMPFLSKPFTPAQLLAKVKEVLDGC